MKITPIYILLIGILLLPHCLLAEEVSLTLDQAIAILLRENSDILLKAEEVKKAKSKISEAEAGQFPSLTVSGSWTDTRGLYAKDTTGLSSQIGLKHYLYTGGETVNTIKYNQQGLAVAQAVLDKAKLDAILQLKKAYYTLLISAELADINKAILSNTKEHLESLRLRYANGQASQSDILKIDASSSSAEQAYEASLNQIESSQELLRNLLKLDKDVSITAEAVLDYEKGEIAYEQAFLQALSRRPEIRQYEAEINASKSAVEIAKAGRRPSVYGSCDYYSRSTLSASTTKNWNDYNIVGITVSWPVFDGWITKAKIGQALADLQAARITKDKTTGILALNCGRHTSR